MFSSVGKLIGNNMIFSLFIKFTKVIGRDNHEKFEKSREKA